ncbi:RNA polymerase sigma factor [Blastococcus sp. PRF04-17]|uniref:RNA polymerase sigma factor n=1 Tax=Blastococcus sp. PRF04-17 TaxID=2933797 RepID=UPI001FF349FA|nr:sigma-70 family RNA polymerase sigma factor [Blastococcus sp. PRF04-17]UOY02179.1 sigma-70 family RNA polymerase sigma factor [Blastococcus sp. PRF04-17]
MRPAADDAARRGRFEDVVAAVYEPVQRYLLRRADPATADDVLGDVLLVLWRRLDDVPADAVLPWTYGVARGCLANSRRSAVRQERVVQRLAQVSRAEEEPDPEGDLAEALQALPEADRELLRLWAWEQLAPREIALALETSPNAVSIRLHRAKQKLKAALLAVRDPTGKNGDGSGHSGVREGGGAR